MKLSHQNKLLNRNTTPGNIINLFLGALLLAGTTVNLESRADEINAVVPANASTNVSANSEAWRKTPPVISAPSPFKMPSAISYKLANGLTVQLLEDHRVPFITVFLGIKAGSTLESADRKGVAAMTADMLTEGTTQKTSKQIADEIDFIGGGLKGSSDYDYTIVSGSALSKYKDRLFNLMSDVVLNPSFPESELKLQKTNLLQELVIKRSSPDFLQDERFAKVVFGDHPYSVVAPTPQSVEKIETKDLQSFHKIHYLPNDSVLIVVGDFNEKTMRDLIANDFGKQWQSGSMPIVEQPNPPKLHGRKIYLVDRPGSVQSNVKLGNLGIKKSDPDYFPFVVTNQILGGAAHSRLFLNIREQKGYTYGAYSGFAARKDPGAFAAEADVRTEVTSPSLQEFLYELERIRNVKVSDKELLDAKRYLVGSFQLGLETQAGLAQKLLEVQMYNLPKDYLETYANKVDSVTVDDIRRVARKHIDTNDMAIVVVGDAAKIKPDLNYFAPIEVFNTKGMPVKEASTTNAAKTGL